jgi:8-oxo-dGTP diphosphatase
MKDGGVAMSRITRYQGAIIDDHNILLIKHREHATGRGYWLIPGGGREAIESEEACVVREMKEETQLDVRVERLIIDEPSHTDDGVYKRYKTYLCRPIGGAAAPGYEPEEEAAAFYSISEVRWFDLRDESTWGDLLRQDPFTYPLLQRLRRVLEYTP